MRHQRSSWTRRLVSPLGVWLLTAGLLGCGKSGPAGAEVDAGKLPEQGSISGQVLVDGEGVPDAEITLNSKMPGVVAGAAIRSGADGSFTWGGPAGTYEVVVKSAGEEILRQTVTFKPGNSNPPVKLEAKAP